jgi:N-ethylmaleimide reductase
LSLLKFIVRQHEQTTFINTINNINLKNRVVVAPMTRGRADNEGNVPTDDLHGLYYEQRASGFNITEGAQVSLDAIGYINTAGIHTDEQVEGWKK